MNVADKIKKILERDYCITNVQDDAVLTKDLGFDELDMIEFIITIEKEFNITLPEETVKFYNITFATLVDKVRVCSDAVKKKDGLRPVAGFYAVSKKQPVCCITGKKCKTISQQEVASNSERFNLCRRNNCLIEYNVRRLTQKTK